LPADTKLYHRTKTGKLKENRDEYLYVAKRPEYLPTLGIWDTSDSAGIVYTFRNRTALRIPDKWDKRLLNSIGTYFNTAVQDTSYPLKKRKGLQNMKDSFEELFTGVYLDDGPNVRIMAILMYLAVNTDFPEKRNINGFHDTVDKYDNYCIFRWREKLDIVEYMTYKNFMLKNQLKS
jgi:hypothetical protein